MEGWGRCGDIAAVVKRASTTLRRDLAARKAPRRPMIVLDIDETSLFNAPCMEYKSGARATLERHGYTILENVGDQQSDLAGGRARHRYKLPNPVYVTT